MWDKIKSILKRDNDGVNNNDKINKENDIVKANDKLHNSIDDKDKSNDEAEFKFDFRDLLCSIRDKIDYKFNDDLPPLIKITSDEMIFSINYHKDLIKDKIDVEYKNGHSISISKYFVEIDSLYLTSGFFNENEFSFSNESKLKVVAIQEIISTLNKEFDEFSSNNRNAIELFFMNKDKQLLDDSQIKIINKLLSQLEKLIIKLALILSEAKRA